MYVVCNHSLQQSFLTNAVHFSTDEPAHFVDCVQSDWSTAPRVDEATEQRLRQELHKVIELDVADWIEFLVKLTINVRQAKASRQVVTQNLYTRAEK